jgi:protein SHQ1
LTLPGQVVEDDESSAKYDIASGILSISLSKVNPGEEFPDLDLTNRLLARTGEVVDDKGTVKGPPRIQVMDDSPSMEDNIGTGDPWADGAYDDALMFDFQISQTLPETVEIATGASYGFNHQYSGHFLHLQNPDVLTLVDAESKSAIERWETMRSQEDEKFDRDWYLADKFEPTDELVEILQHSLPGNLDDPLTSEEQLHLRNLGNRECNNFLVCADDSSD